MIFSENRYPLFRIMLQRYLRTQTVKKLPADTVNGSFRRSFAPIPLPLAGGDLPAISSIHEGAARHDRIRRRLIETIGLKRAMMRLAPALAVSLGADVDTRSR
jgi:hypothetical protein